MLVREYQTSDLESLRDIYLRSRIFAFPFLETERFRPEDFDKDTEGEIILVAVHEDRIIGFSSSWKQENFIHSIYLDPNYIRKGFGRHLLNRTLELLDMPVRLKCVKRNIRAFKFYESQGWRIVDEGTNESGDHYVMELGNIPDVTV